MHTDGLCHRQQLLQVDGAGAEDDPGAAGCSLYIRGGDNPLDMTGVHPETYPVVERILAAAGRPIEAVMGKAEVLRALKPEAFADDRFGVVTVRDILSELEKPGARPAAGFPGRALRRHAGSEGPQARHKLEGTVTNVAQFGAFVDVGVHQDGLGFLKQYAEHPGALPVFQLRNSTILNGYCAG